jgi:hypothetical protein
MLILLHYLPYMLFAGLAGLALVTMFGQAESGKRPHLQRLPRQHYVWSGHNSRHY